MSFTTSAQRALDVASSGFHGLEIIGQLAAAAIPQVADHDRMLAVLRAITAVIDSVKAGWDGTATVDDVKASLQVVRDQIADNDHIADNSLTALFAGLAGSPR
jgi:hypothetical protein